MRFQLKVICPSFYRRSMEIRLWFTGYISGREESAEMSAAASRASADKVGIKFWH